MGRVPFVSLNLYHIGIVLLLNDVFNTYNIALFFWQSSLSKQRKL